MPQSRHSNQRQGMSASRIEAYRKQFRLLASRTGADRFLSWWLRELFSLVPAWMRMQGDRTDSLILLEMDASTVVLKQQKKGKWLEAGRLERNGTDIAAQRSAFLALLNTLDKRPDEAGISLAPHHVLRKSFKLPLAVEENLAQVLGFEMDRHTPFKGDHVYFDYRIIGRDARLGQLEVEIVLAPRAVVDEMLALANRWGASVQGVWLADELAMTPPPRSNLLPPALRVSGKSPLHQVNLALAVLTGILLLAALIIPIWQKRESAILLRPLTDNARQQAEATDALHRELDRRVAEYNHLLERKQSVPVMVAVLDELTRLLPDNTWVQQLDVKGKELQIQGETASSSQLVGLFEQSKILRDASFKSPLTKVPGGEHFQLALEVKAPPPEAAKPEEAGTKSEQPAQPTLVPASQKAVSLPAAGEAPPPPMVQSQSPAPAAESKALPASATPAKPVEQKQ